MQGPGRGRRWEHLAVAAGAGLLVAGAIGIQSNGGLATAQWPASASEFDEHVRANLDDVLAANLADAVLFVPGYTLIALGVASWVRRSPGGDGRIGTVARTGSWLVVVAAVTDTIENVLLRRGASDPPASTELVSAMKSFGAVKYATVAVGAVAIIGAGLTRWWRQRT